MHDHSDRPAVGTSGNGTREPELISSEEVGFLRLLLKVSAALTHPFFKFSSIFYHQCPFMK